MAPLARAVRNSGSDSRLPTIGRVPVQELGPGLAPGSRKISRDNQEEPLRPAGQDEPRRLVYLRRPGAPGYDAARAVEDGINRHVRQREPVPCLRPGQIVPHVRDDIPALLRSRIACPRHGRNGRQEVGDRHHLRGRRNVSDVGNMRYQGNSSARSAIARDSARRNTRPGPRARASPRIRSCSCIARIAGVGGSRPRRTLRPALGGTVRGP